MLAEGTAAPGRAAVAAVDEVPVGAGDDTLLALAAQVLERLPAAGLAAGAPPFPFAEFLLRREAPDARALVPRDAETRTFLHEIPILRAGPAGSAGAARIAGALRQRKAVLVEGVGFVAAGPLDPGQACTAYSCAVHGALVKYLVDVARDGFLVPGEEEAFGDLAARWLAPLPHAEPAFGEEPLEEPRAVAAAMAEAGRLTAAMGLVDASFGNVSYRTRDAIYISRTGAPLDDLAGEIDAVSLDGSSTAGITASTELPAHRAIYENCGVRAILHGHPKAAVVTSLLCDEKDCPILDCWRDCDRVRFAGGVPVVAGEPGAGGLAERVAPAVREYGRALVYGHGIFAAGRSGLAEAFTALVEAENRCRKEYLARLGRGRLPKS